MYGTFEHTGNVPHVSQVTVAAALSPTWLNVVVSNTQVYRLPYMVMASKSERDCDPIELNDLCKWSFGVDNVVVF